MRFFDHFVVAYFFGPPCSDTSNALMSNVGQRNKFSTLEMTDHLETKLL